MSQQLHENHYYKTSEVCRNAGISRSTLSRWVDTGLLGNLAPNDMKKRGLFTKSELEKIKAETRVFRDWP